MRQDHASRSWTLRMRGREVSMATKASTPVPVLGDTECFGGKLPAAVKKKSETELAPQCGLFSNCVSVNCSIQVATDEP